MKKAGYDLSYALVDTKLALGVIAVLVALMAQFWPGTDKNSPYVLGPCVAGYFILTSLVWAIQVLIQKDAIAYTKGHPGNPGIVLRSKMPRYGDQYTLRACMKDDSGLAMESSSTQYVGTFFNEDAVVQIDSIVAMVNEVLHQLDAPSESSNDNKKEM